MAIMEAGRFGPREILPESMHEGLTRITFGVGPNSHAGRASLGFETSSSGVWLPHRSLSELDLATLLDRMHRAKAHNYFLTDYSQLVADRRTARRIDISGQGCWQSDHFSASSMYPYATDNHYALETEDQLEGRRLCDTPDCVYHRHYDATSGVPSGRRELLYPNAAYFKKIGGKILTAWGNILPPVDESRECLQALQRECPPHVDPGLLTFGGISKLSLIPVTGCWHTASYSMTPTGERAPKGWQYDGYGRLGLPKETAEQLGLTSSQMLGHRRTWAITGNHLDQTNRYVLNHMCGFRPCCNPLHLEQIAHYQNNAHGKIMDTAVDMTERGMDMPDGVDLMLRLSRGLLGVSSQAIQDFWE